MELFDVYKILKVYQGVVILKQNLFNLKAYLGAEYFNSEKLDILAFRSPSLDQPENAKASQTCSKWLLLH